MNFNLIQNKIKIDNPNINKYITDKIDLSKILTSMKARVIR